MSTATVMRRTEINAYNTYRIQYMCAYKHSRNYVLACARTLSLPDVFLICFHLITAHQLSVLSGNPRGPRRNLGRLVCALWGPTGTSRSQKGQLSKEPFWIAQGRPMRSHGPPRRETSDVGHKADFIILQNINKWTNKWVKRIFWYNQSTDAGSGNHTEDSK